MNIRFYFSTTGLRAMYAIFKYYVSLRRLSDEELSQVVARERRSRGWCSQRSYFLAALKRVCAERKIEYCRQ